MIKNCPYCNKKPVVRYIESKIQIACINTYCNVRPVTKILSKKIVAKYWNTRSTFKYIINFFIHRIKPCKFCGNKMSFTKIHNNDQRYKIFCSHCCDYIYNKFELYRNPNILVRMWNIK